MIRALALALPILAIPPHAYAADLLGTITATMGDAPAQDWFVTAEGGESQSALAKMPGVPLHDVSLWGNTSADETASLKGALLLDFSVMGSGGAATVMDATLQYLEEGYSGGYLAGSDGDLAITLTRFDESGDGLAIAGDFTATATFSDNLAAMSTDPSKTRSFSGTFEVTLPLQ